MTPHLMVRVMQERKDIYEGISPLPGSPLGKRL